MKKIVIITLALILLNVSVFAHKQEMHQYITREAFDLLKMSFPIGFTGLDEMENYLGYDESTNSSLAIKSIGDFKIVAGAWMEDEWDVVYHYGTPDLPDYQGIPPWLQNTIWPVVGIFDGDARRKAHSTITHFWNADNGGENATTYLTDIVLWDTDIFTWHFTISENSMQKTRRYYDGNYVERRVYNYLININNTMVMAADWELPGIVDIYNCIGEDVLVGYYNSSGQYQAYPDPYVVPIAEWYDWWREGYVYNRFGRMCHLLQDNSVPVHVNCTSHAGPDHEMHVDFFESHEMDYLENYHAWTAIEVYNEFGGFIDPYVHDDPIYFLMYFLNQITDHYADGKVNGDDNYDSSFPGLSAIIPSLGVPTLTSEINDANCKQMYDILIPYAIKVTAGLMYWFAVETDQIDPLPEPVIVSGNVSLNGGSGDITNVQIKFSPQIYGLNIVYINPDINGNFSHTFSYDQFGTYDVTYKLYSTDEDYYPITVENVVINTTTSPLTLTNVTLHPILSNDLVMVSADMQNPQAFHNIQAAISYLEGNEGGTVNILPGIYTGLYNTGLMWWNGPIKVRGTDIDNCIIDCEGSGSGFNLLGVYNDTDIIENLTIINGEQGIVIENYGENGPVIRNNIITDCELSWMVSSEHGVGISCKGPATIENNLISNCVGVWKSTEEYYYKYGGGIYIENNSDSSVYIRNNIIDNCQAQDGGGIYCTGSGDIEITGNKITNCSLCLSWDGFDPNANIAVCAFECNVLLFSNNLIVNNINSYTSYYRSMFICNYNSSPASIILQNNTFSNNIDMRGIWSYVYSCDELIISNTVISGHTIGITVQNGTEAPAINYCLLNNDLNYSGDVVLSNCLLDYDAELDDEGLDPSFQPIWNETIMSPCIDSGDPASPFDPDDTPADIGAVRAVSHDYHLTTAEVDRYRWRSFPVIDRDYILQGFETTYICAPVEEQTQYFKIFDQEDIEKVWIPITWSGDLNDLDSVIGYKLQTTSDVEIPTSGITLPEDTRVYLDAGNNWVGYFIEESMTLQDAFAEIWDHITAIYSEDWAWANPGIPSNRCALVYGKMYNVRVDEACDFVYGEGSSVDPEEREMTEGFYYVETPDYSPINIESLDDPTVLEVGVFLDGECIGATQVEEFPLQILAFPLETPRGSGDITFEFYCGGRSYKPAKEYKVLNKETGHYDNSKIELRPYEFTTICFGNPVTPAKFTLTGNYPNPFNPSTTISYSIPSDGNVELIVYNIRGQKVKTLISGTQPTGVYNVTWNGKDENDSSVSSGLYFYKLRSSGKIAVKKMLLLK